MVIFTASSYRTEIFVLMWYRLVLETLEPLPGDRKCFRMINGVLTERTVKEVVPILKTNSDGLKKALEELVKQYKTKQDDMEKWKVRLQLSPSRTTPWLPLVPLTAS
jgi:chaperonin cofactor prefoldin